MLGEAGATEQPIKTLGNRHRAVMSARGLLMQHEVALSLDRGADPGHSIILIGGDGRRPG